MSWSKLLLVGLVHLWGLNIYAQDEVLSSDQTKLNSSAPEESLIHDSNKESSHPEQDNFVEVQTEANSRGKSETGKLDSSPQQEPSQATSGKEELEVIEQPFKMQEYRTNYFISGKPDSKIQFSFLFRLLKNYKLYLGYTQIMFWELGQEDSNPFSDINFNPELFYKLDFKEGFFFDHLDMGYAHTSNGLDGPESRAMDEVFLQFGREAESGLGITKIELRLRYIFEESLTDNPDLKDYYGPLMLRLHFTRLGRRLFFTEQFYVEYYNGGNWANDFSKNSVRLSMRFKPFRSLSAPKIFLQYFNGYGENLKNYNQRDESFRIGLSIGGQ